MLIAAIGMLFTSCEQEKKTEQVSVSISWCNTLGENLYIDLTDMAISSVAVYNCADTVLHPGETIIIASYTGEIAYAGAEECEAMLDE